MKHYSDPEIIDRMSELMLANSELERKIEQLERKAWECSVEMMEKSREHSDNADTNQTSLSVYVIRQNGIAAGYKYSAYKLREAFGFPKSEAPEKFNEKKEG